MKQLFNTTQGQVANLLRLNRKHHWGFTAEDFANLPPPPPWPKQPLGAVVLVPYLATPGETITELWIAAFGRLKMHWNDARLPPEEREVRMLEGITHRPGLCWEVIDFGAHLGKNPIDVRGPDSAHAGILAAAVHSKRWANALGGAKAPSVWLAGYRTALQGTKNWAGTLCLVRSNYAKTISLDVQAADKGPARCATPVILCTSRAA